MLGALLVARNPMVATNPMIARSSLGAVSARLAAVGHESRDGHILRRPWDPALSQRWLGAAALGQRWPGACCCAALGQRWPGACRCCSLPVALGFGLPRRTRLLVHCAAELLCPVLRLDGPRMPHGRCPNASVILILLPARGSWPPPTVPKHAHPACWDVYLEVAAGHRV